MHMYEDLKDRLCEELGEIAEKDITVSSLDMIDKLTHSIKSLATIIAMEDYGDSYARGRSRVTGRYISRDDGYSSRRYSMEGKHERFVDELEELMAKAPDEKIRNQLRKTISDVNNNV